MKKLTELIEWQLLQRQQQKLATMRMSDWFNEDPCRSAHFSLEVGDILLDYSRNRLTQETLTLLFQLTEQFHLNSKIDAMFNGHAINSTEKRPALHTALRDRNHAPIWVNGQNIAELIFDCRQKIEKFVDQIHSGEWRGATGKSIQHIVNIGIGGSYLGPMMATHALADYAISNLQFYFVSSIDKAQLDDALKQIDPETVLFIISSKSFSTLETLTNARSAYSWLENKLGKDKLHRHFIAVTAAAQKTIPFGIPEEQIFPMWDWVGGRYSVWSAIGLPLTLMIGNKHFRDFLDGAYAMDQHFRFAPVDKNMPILLGLLGIWYMNFFDAKAHAVIPYSYRLRHLPSYLQQAEMESNGKGVANNGAVLEYLTSPVIFGEEGCNGQHAFYQLLHQGQHLIPVDFVLIGHNHYSTNDNHQDILIASGLSQAQALMHGKTHEEVREELRALDYSAEEIDHLAYHQAIPGNKPSNILFLNKLTPKNLGALLALYEHKIFVQGTIWNINSFDQWGVELGKQLLPSILQRLVNTPSGNAKKLNFSTEADSITRLIAYYHKLKEI